MALGYWVNPGWFLFTAFVGLNLFQSAFTNWCPMITILRKLESVGVDVGQAASPMSLYLLWWGGPPGPARVPLDPLFARRAPQSCPTN